MTGPNYVALFLQVLEAYALCKRHQELTTYQVMAQMGRMSQAMAKALLYQLEGPVREQERRTNLLERAPAFEELYPHGAPDLLIGEVEEAQDVPLGLSLTGNMNSIFSGKSGFGKTTGLRSLIHSVCKHNRSNPDRFVSVAVWDRKGGDYADLSLLGPEWIHLSLETMKVALNSPEGVPPNIWINAVSTIFAARAGLVVSSVCLANMMRFLLGAMNPNPGQAPLQWPSFQQLLDLARLAPLSAFAEKPEYGKSLIQMLEGVTQAGGTLFQASSSTDLETIARQKKCVVLDVYGLGPPWVRALATDILMYRLLLGRQWRYQRRSTVDCLVVVDEADSDTSAKSEAAFPDLSPLSTFLKQCREYGLAVALGISALGLTARQILTNASHHFFFAMSDAESLREASNTLLLRPRAESILPALEPGECLYRGPGPWAHAMLARLASVPPSRMKRPEQYDSHPYTPSQKLTEIPHIRETVLDLVARQESLRLRQSKPAKGNGRNLPQRDLKLLLTAAANPWWPFAKLEDLAKLNLSPQARIAIRKNLENQGYAEFAEMRLGSSPVILMSLTDKGWEAAACKPPSRTGRGSIQHRHVANWIAMAAAKEGLKAACEQEVNGHPMDCGVTDSNGRLRAYEVVIDCESNLLDHITNLSQVANIESITVVCLQKQILQRLQRQLQAQLVVMTLGDRLRWELTETFYRRLWP
jgi:hypothetical protein